MLLILTIIPQENYRTNKNNFKKVVFLKKDLNKMKKTMKIKLNLLIIKKKEISYVLKTTPANKIHNNSKTACKYTLMWLRKTQ